MIKRHAKIAHIKTDCAVFPQITLRSHQLSNKLIKSHARADGIFHPSIIEPGGLTLGDLRIDTQKISLPIIHVTDIAFGQKQFIDQLRAFVTIPTLKETSALF